ncbi:MAG TPA: hypothetical protein VEB86_03110 [Chryseosolibacter sp.]|nr:hypothetical protein [Chryseosolibacter sp.]
MLPKNLWKTAIALTVATLVAGCWGEPYEAYTPMAVEGYRPEYGSEQAREIAFLAPKTLQNPGKIYVYGQYLLVNEKGKGVHVFDNSDPSSPEPKGFIQLLGNSDMAIRNDVLYADHLGSLVSIDLNAFTDLQKTGSLPLQNWNLGVPPPPASYFECVDQSRGVVTGWTRAELQNPACYAY